MGKLKLRSYGMENAKYAVRGAGILNKSENPIHGNITVLLQPKFINVYYTALLSQKIKFDAVVSVERFRNVPRRTE